MKKIIAILLTLCLAFEPVTPRFLFAEDEGPKAKEIRFKVSVTQEPREDGSTKVDFKVSDENDDEVYSDSQICPGCPPCEYGQEGEKGEKGEYGGGINPICCQVTVSCKGSRFDQEVNDLILEQLKLNQDFLAGIITYDYFERKTAGIQNKIKVIEKHQIRQLRPQTLVKLKQLREQLVMIRINAILSGDIPNGTKFTPEQLGIKLPPGIKEIKITEKDGKKGFWLRGPGKDWTFRGLDGSESVYDENTKLLYTRKIIKNPGEEPKTQIIFPDGSTMTPVNPHVNELRDKDGKLKGHQVSPDSLKKLEDAKTPEESKKIAQEIAKALGDTVFPGKNVEALADFLDSWSSGDGTTDPRKKPRDMEMFVDANGEITTKDKFDACSEEMCGKFDTANRTQKLFFGKSTKGLFGKNPPEDALILREPVITKKQGNETVLINEHGQRIYDSSPLDPLDPKREFLGNGERLDWQRKKTPVPPPWWNPFGKEKIEIQETIIPQKQNPDGTWIKHPDPKKTPWLQGVRTVEKPGTSAAEIMAESLQNLPGIKEAHEYVFAPVGNTVSSFLIGAPQRICGLIQGSASGAFNNTEAEIREFRGLVGSWPNGLSLKNEKSMEAARKWIEQLRKDGKYNELAVLWLMVEKQREKEWEDWKKQKGITKENEEAFRKRYGEEYDKMRKKYVEAPVTDDDMVRFLLTGDITGSSKLAEMAEKDGSYFLGALAIVTRAGEGVIENLPTLLMFHAFGFLGEAFAASTCPAVYIPGYAMVTCGKVFGATLGVMFGTDAAQALHDVITELQKGDKADTRKVIDLLGKLAADAAVIAAMKGFEKGGKNIFEHLRDLEIQKQHAERALKDPKISKELRKSLENELKKVDRKIGQINKEVFKETARRETAKPAGECPCLLPESSTLLATEEAAAKAKAKEISGQAKAKADELNKKIQNGEMTEAAAEKEMNNAIENPDNGFRRRCNDLKADISLEPPASTRPSTMPDILDKLRSQYEKFQKELEEIDSERMEILRRKDTGQETERDVKRLEDLNKRYQDIRNRPEYRALVKQIRALEDPILRQEIEKAVNEMGGEGSLKEALDKLIKEKEQKINELDKKLAGLKEAIKKREQELKEAIKKKEQELKEKGEKPEESAELNRMKLEAQAELNRMKLEAQDIWDQGTGENARLDVLKALRDGIGENIPPLIKVEPKFNIPEEVLRNALREAETRLEEAIMKLKAVEKSEAYKNWQRDVAAQTPDEFLTPHREFEVALEEAKKAEKDVIEARNKLREAGVEAPPMLLNVTPEVKPAGECLDGGTRQLAPAAPPPPAADGTRVIGPPKGGGKVPGKEVPAPKIETPGGILTPSTEFSSQIARADRNIPVGTEVHLKKEFYDLRGLEPKEVVKPIRRSGIIVEIDGERFIQRHTPPGQKPLPPLPLKVNGERVILQVEGMPPMSTVKPDGTKTVTLYRSLDLSKLSPEQRQKLIEQIQNQGVESAGLAYMKEKVQQQNPLLPSEAVEAIAREMLREELRSRGINPDDPLALFQATGDAALGMPGGGFATPVMPWTADPYFASKWPGCAPKDRLIIQIEVPIEQISTATDPAQIRADIKKGKFVRQPDEGYESENTSPGDKVSPSLVTRIYLPESPLRPAYCEPCSLLPRSEVKTGEPLVDSSSGGKPPAEPPKKGGGKPPGDIGPGISQKSDVTGRLIELLKSYDQEKQKFPSADFEFWENKAKADPELASAIQTLRQTAPSTLDLAAVAAGTKPASFLKIPKPAQIDPLTRALMDRAKGKVTVIEWQLPDGNTAVVMAKNPQWAQALKDLLDAEHSGVLPKHPSGIVADPAHHIKIGLLLGIPETEIMKFLKQHESKFPKPYTELEFQQMINSIRDRLPADAPQTEQKPAVVKTIDSKLSIVPDEPIHSGSTADIYKVKDAGGKTSALKVRKDGELPLQDGKIGSEAQKRLKELEEKGEYPDATSIIPKIQKAYRKVKKPDGTYEYQEVPVNSPNVDAVLTNWVEGKDYNYNNPEHQAAYNKLVETLRAAGLEIGDPNPENIKIVTGKDGKMKAVYIDPAGIDVQLPVGKQ